MENILQTRKNGLRGVKLALSKIYETEISEFLWTAIIEDVQKKKELASFSEAYIEKYATHLLKKNAKLRSIISQYSDIHSIRNNNEYKKLIKDVREKARRIYGLYIIKNYWKKDIQNFEELLGLHRSTKERLDNYLEFYEVLFKYTCVPKSILDLACGLNPASIPLFKYKLDYFASDISEQDVYFLNALFADFKKKKLISQKSIAFRADLSDENDLSKLCAYQTDWCLLLKALDPVEESNQNITYKIIPAIESRWIIATFPTVTASNQPMRNPRRNWFEKVLKRLNKEYTTIQIGNELCYIIKNSV